MTKCDLASPEQFEKCADYCLQLVQRIKQTNQHTYFCPVVLKNKGSNRQIVEMLQITLNNYKIAFQ